MTPQISKNLPSASNEIAELFNYNASATSIPTSKAEVGGVNDTPTAAVDVTPIEPELKNSLSPDLIDADIAAINKQSNHPVVKVLKTIAPFVLVFAIGVFVYYFWFTDFSFYNLFKSTATPTTTVTQTAKLQQAALDSLYQTEKSNYETWINQFYFEVNDPKITDPNTDNSGNGLTNFQKYLLGLNPRAYDSLGLGKNDTQSIKDGINPLTGTPLTNYQREVIKQYLNIDIAEQKSASGPLLGAETAYAEVTSGTPVVTTQSKPALVVTKKAVTQTKKVNTVTTNQPLFNILNIPVGENVQNINTGTQGTLNVPALGINAPINWTQDLSTIDADLDKGVVHMPGTPMPGDVGTTYISGHSSGYAWDNSPYKNVFTQLSKLGNGDKIYVTFTNTSGKTVKLTYTFDRQGEFKPGDQNQFINTADPEIALSTCWPIGGTAKRLVVYAKLTSIE